MRLSSWALVLSSLALAACPSKAEDQIRLGVDASLKETGLANYLQAAFEQKSKKRIRLIYANTAQLQKKAEEGELDSLLMVSEASLAAFRKEGLAQRMTTYAHEEFLFIGPFKNYLGKYSDSKGHHLMRNIARSNYRYLKGAAGSVERARHDWLFKKGGDRSEPGAFFDGRASGKALVKAAIETNAFSLVRRSSVLLLAREGKHPHRIYSEADPALVLRYVVAQIHPEKTKRPVRTEFYDFLMSEEGKELIAGFGKDRLGHALFSPGEPEPDLPASTEPLKAWLKAKVGKPPVKEAPAKEAPSKDAPVQ